MIGRIMRIAAWVLVAGLSGLAALLVWVALDTGPSPRLAYERSAIPAPYEVPKSDFLDIDAMCRAFDENAMTTVRIMQQIRNPAVRTLVGFIRGELSPWSPAEVNILNTHLDTFLTGREFEESSIAVIARSGGSGVAYLKAIENAPANAVSMVNQCGPSGELRADGETVHDCIDRNWGDDQEPFAYTHTGFLMRNGNGQYNVLHAYPVNYHLEFFCEPLSVFLGVPLDIRQVMVMLPPGDKQGRIREILEGPLSTQVRRMRYSLTSPPDAPNFTNSNGFTFQTIMASNNGSEYDLRDAETVYAQSSFLPSVILFGHTFVGRLLDLIIPVLDLTTQPYAKQGVFDTVTPISMYHHVKKQGWIAADFNLDGWSLRNPDLPADMAASNDSTPAEE